jgi:glycosyltransferase involved in cell wall biosynthesis
MKLSVLVTTYNALTWLEKVIWGYAAQTHRDFELIIADDGSSPETADRIRALRRETGLDLVHLWQADEGFQKCRVLNKAIVTARHDYLVFSDGDCIPRADFLAVHAARAQPGYYLSGSYYKLPMHTSEAIGLDDIRTQRCFQIDWLRAHGLPTSRKNLKVIAGPRLARFLNATTPTRCNLKGSNASAWREDVLRVNGFDERMQWGGLDREFGVRLLNAGVKARHVRFDAICLHLDHPRGYANPERVAYNKALRKSHARQGTVETQHGIRQLLASGFTPDQALLPP